MARRALFVSWRQEGTNMMTPTVPCLQLTGMDARGKGERRTRDARHVDGRKTRSREKAVCSELQIRMGSELAPW